MLACCSMLLAQQSPPKYKIQIDQLLLQADEKLIEHHREGFALANHALQLALKNNDPVCVGRAYRILCYLHQEFGEYDAALAAGQKGLAADPHNEALGCDLLNRMGLVYFRQAQYHHAQEYFNQAMQRGRAAQYSDGEAEALLDSGLVYWKTGRLDKALDYILQALKQFERTQNLQKIAGAYLSLGNVYFESKEIDQAIGAYEKALALARKTSFRRQEAALLGNIGYMYRKKADYVHALQYFDQALLIWRRIDEKIYLGNTLYYIGSVYLDQGKWQKALDFLTESRRVKQQINETWDVIRSSIAIASAYRNLSRLSEAKTVLVKLMDDARQVDALPLQQDIQLEWSKVCEAQGEYGEALAHYKEFNALQDRISSSESQKRIAVLREEFDAENRDKEIQLLKRQTEIGRLQIIRERTWLYFFAAGLGIVLLFGGLLFFFYQQKKRAHRQLERALSELKVLSGLLPICAWCKKIRDDDGYWQQVEIYLAKHSDVAFTHSICPECKAKVSNDLG